MECWSDGVLETLIEAQLLVLHCGVKNVGKCPGFSPGGTL
jgi:hypothetical protein